jgi:hypothetical protein
MKPPFDRRFGVDQVALDLFSAEGAPSLAELPASPIDCPAPLGGAVHRYRMPLWRLFGRTQ